MLRSILLANRMKAFACLFIFISSLFSPVFAQEQIGQPKIINYNFKDYDGQPRIDWAIEGDNGLMYFTNVNSIIEYDGVTWTKIIDHYMNSFISLSKDESGRIFVGGTGDLGFIEADDNGKWNFRSLKERIPEIHRDFGNVWETFYLDDKIYFTTDYKLFIWDGEEFSVVEVKEGIHVTTTAHNKLFSRIWDKGLCQLVDNKYVVVPGGERFASSRIYQILEYDEKNLLIGTNNEGFFIYNGEEFIPFKTDIDELVEGQLYLPGAAINNRFVINTRSSGAYLINKQGDLLQSFTTDNGLQNSNTSNVYVDSRNFIWISNSLGVSMVDLESPYTYIGSSNGLAENDQVGRMVANKNELYISAASGVYKKSKSENQFEKLESIGNVSSLLNFRGRIYFTSGSLGFGEITGDSVEIIKKDEKFEYRLSGIYHSTYNSNRIFLSSQKGLFLFYFDEEKDQFYEEGYIKDFPFLPEEDSEGNLWTTNNEPGKVIKLIPEKKQDELSFVEYEIKEYTSEHGLPEDVIVQPFKPFDSLYIVSDAQKAYIFNEETEKFKEIQTQWTKYSDFTNLTRFESRNSENTILANYGKGILLITRDENGIVKINPDMFKNLNNELFPFALIEDPSSDGSKTIWFGGYDGITRYEGNLSNPKIQEFETRIRQIMVGRDSIVYGGIGELPTSLHLKPDNSTMTFNYAAPIFSGQDNIEYSTSLEGLEIDAWSKWSKQSSREYVNLPSGEYNFKVKSRTIVGQESDITEFPFYVNTPWYLTWWAYFIYALLAVALVFMIVRTRTGILRDRQKELETSVDERTLEVQKRMNELATVNHVSQALTEKLKLNELIKLVGDEMKKLFNSDITYLALLDEDTNLVNFPYQDGDNIAPQKFGNGLTSKIIMTGKPLLINKDKDIDAEYEKMGVEQSGKPAVSYLGVPIPSEDKIIGVLSVQSTEHESRFNEEDKRLLNTIAINVGIALHNAELYEQARLAKLKAEEANEAKSAFLSTVSHELRTPLTSVLGFAKIIRKRLEDKIFPNVNIEDQKIKRTMKQVTENLNVVVSEGERLTTLINDVLDLAKIESGKMEWNMRPVFLQDAISRAIASTQSLFEHKGLKLKKKVPSDLPLVNADEDKLIQVVINLISNAVKFTDTGKVEIDAYQDKDQIIVEIQDTGIGIAEEDHYKVFEKFRQAGDTLTDKPKGTGLGLPICREIIEHHGGIIWMTSEPGVGSTFYFSIPVMSKTKEHQPVQLDRIITSLKKQIKHSQNGSSKKATILVVDDATPIRSLLRQELTEAGYHVNEAADGKLALDMVRNSKPDLIILDVMMPEINGFDVAAVLKNDPATMDIPIIILSIVQDKERGLKIGVDRYLTKPINTEELFHEVDVLLEQGVSKKKVLVVDEDASAVNSLSEVLSARGYKVMNSNGENLYQSATESQPDIIMLNSVYHGDQKTIRDIKLQKGMENVMFFIYE